MVSLSAADRSFASEDGKSVDLDGAVDLGDEPEAGVEADGGREDEEGEADHAHVPEVERRGNEPVHVQLREEVPHRIEHDVSRTAAAAHHAAPPPAVVLVAELEVAHEDGRLGARGDEDGHDEEEETEDVVDWGNDEGGR